MTQADMLTINEHLDARERAGRLDRYVRTICVCVAAVSVAVAGTLVLPGIHEQRKSLELVVSDSSFGDMPPDVALPSALLSTFRGLLIHIIWARSEELKEEGKYYELQQLSDWICELQPRFPKVWENAAWNMAYNISVGTYSERERWYWVSAGAFILRDQGIPKNPKTIDLYKELAWIYLHKMGDFLDDHHKAYKRNWAVIAERVLGAPSTEADDQAIIDETRVIAEAAKDIRRHGLLGSDGVFQLYIEADKESPSMSDFITRMSAIGYSPDEEFLEAVARYIREDDLIELELIANPQGILAEELQRAQQMSELMTDSKLAPARDRLLSALRAHILKRDLKLDPEFMLGLMEKFGPLDWRSVYSQGLYWAALGGQECEEAIGKDENVEMNTLRFVQFGLKDTCERGRIILEPNFDDPFESHIDLLPDFRFTDVAHDLYLEQAEAIRDGENPDKYYADGPAGRHYAVGHVNFLRNAVRELYLEGRTNQAQHYYDYLRENYREKSGFEKEEYLMPMEKFVLQDYFEDMQSYKQASVLIHTMLRSCFLNLAYNRPQEAARRFVFARTGYEEFMSSVDIDPTERRSLPPWPEVRAAGLENFLTRFPLPLFMKARTWRRVDTETKLYVYRRLLPAIKKSCAEHDPPYDPSIAFPEPPGLAEFEERMAKEGRTDFRGDESSELQEVDVSEGSKR